MRFKILSPLAAVAGAALLLACSHEPPRVESVAPPPQAAQPAPEVRTEVTVEESIATVEAPQRVAPVVFNSVFFDFDSATIRNDAQGTILDNGTNLQRGSASKIRLEGNCDERGSREYNLALGDRRAQSVRRRLVMLGVDQSRLEAISYGKEKPRALGHDEAAWAENRRVDFDVLAGAE